MKKEINSDNLNRVALGIIEKFGLLYETALERLGNMRLCLIAGHEIAYSLPLQAALITAVNTGKRAFTGGVSVIIAEDVPLLFTWPGAESLNKVIEELGALVQKSNINQAFRLYFGETSTVSEHDLKVVCSNWRGGVTKGNETSNLDAAGTNPLGGIAAGALAVATAFLAESRIYSAVTDNENGISLWNPDLDWKVVNSEGPVIEILPSQYWLLGLGHLGQGYLWSIGLLPYSDSSNPLIYLQDYDKLVEANIGTGMVAEYAHIGEYKTRVCSDWLRLRNFQTRIIERAFDKNTIVAETEPRLALCGFDNAQARAILENAGFDFIIESALGGTVSSFDNIVLHTFPDALKKPREIWQDGGKDVLHPKALEQFRQFDQGGCGVIAETLAGKAIASSFVGALAGALTIAESVRILNGGKRYDTLVIPMRTTSFRKVIPHIEELPVTRLAPNGFVEISSV